MRARFDSSYIRSELEYTTIELQDIVSRFEEKDTVEVIADRIERLSTTIWP